MTPRRLQACVLWLVGLVEVFAFAAAFMPRAWMEWGHGWLGTGEMPAGPVFESVMRQVSFSYGMHGVALWVIASDVVRYRPLVVLSAAGYLLAAPAFLWFDHLAGMPWSWRAGNSGSCLLIAALLTGLLWWERSSERSIGGANDGQRATRLPEGRG